MGLLREPPGLVHWFVGGCLAWTGSLAVSSVGGTFHETCDLQVYASLWQHVTSIDDLLIFCLRSALSKMLWNPKPVNQLQAGLGGMSLNGSIAMQGCRLLSGMQRFAAVTCSSSCTFRWPIWSSAVASSPGGSCSIAGLAHEGTFAEAINAL